MDKIHLNNLSFFGYHGALPEENVLGQTYCVSLTFEIDIRNAAQTDDLSKTLDYREAIEIVREIITGPSRKLIETLAEQIAQNLLEKLPIAQAVTVHLTKPRPPVGVELAAVAVEIHRTRNR